MNMTTEDKKMLDRINAYADKVLGDIDPQKTHISEQLEKLKPIMETIATEQGKPIEDIFIKYMDLASEAGVEASDKFNQTYGEFNVDIENSKQGKGLFQ